jgi:DNA repair protein RadC
MSYDTVDKLSPAELVAAVLGKKLADNECHRLAAIVTSEDWLDGMPLSMIARESPAFAKRVDRIASAVELGRITMAARATRKANIISTKEDVFALMQPRLAGLEVEKFYCLCLDTKNRLKKIVDVSTGSLNASIVHPRELFRKAVEISACSVVVVHNHPSGNSTPSVADLQLTRRLVAAGDTLGIEVLDHIVIGGDGLTSLRETGEIYPRRR